jgi:hypothetical protein
VTRIEAGPGYPLKNLSRVEEEFVANARSQPVGSQHESAMRSS